MNIVDWILFVLFRALRMLLLLYAIASKFYRVPEFPEARTLRRSSYSFPAYQEPGNRLFRTQFPETGISERNV